MKTLNAGLVIDDLERDQCLRQCVIADDSYSVTSEHGPPLPKTNVFWIRFHDHGRLQVEALRRTAPLAQRLRNDAQACEFAEGINPVASQVNFYPKKAEPRDSP